jgi:hypothetical protein
MHTLTVRTKFTFGDRVRFNSPTQRLSGSGQVFAITVDYEGRIDYLIEVRPGYLQPGILEEEIALEADKN